MTDKYPRKLQMMVLRDDGGGGVETSHMSQGEIVVYPLSLLEMLAWNETLSAAIARKVRALPAARAARDVTGEGP
jgi:hypothetical protein